MRFTHDFAKDFDALIERWLGREPFAFSRFGDGEAAILRGRERPFRTTRRTERWQSSQLQGPFREELHKSLVADLPDYVPGILCPHCSDVSSEYLWGEIEIEPERCTFAEIFGNQNWPKVDWPSFIEQTETFVVGSSEKADLRIPVDLPTRMPMLNKILLQLLELERPIAICGGPAANVLVHRYWLAQSPDLRQVCIDLGSVLDPWLHGDKTRGHHVQGSWDQSLRCTFDRAQTRERGFVPPMFRR